LTSPNVCIVTSPVYCRVCTSGSFLHSSCLQTVDCRQTTCGHRKKNFLRNRHANAVQSYLPEYDIWKCFFK